MSSRNRLRLQGPSSVSIGASAPRVVIEGGGRIRSVPASNVVVKEVLQPRRKKIKNNKERQSRSIGTRALRTSVGTGKAVTSYIQSLNNPFKYASPGLGFGTLEPLRRGTMYRRNTLAISANSFGLAVLQSTAFDMMCLSTATSGNPFTTNLLKYPASNSAYVANSFQEARILTGGMRVRVLNAATNSNPIAYCGLIHDTLDGITALTPTALQSQPALKICSTTEGVYEALYRPYDVSDLGMAGSTVSNSAGWPTNFIQPLEVIMVYNSGVASISILIEDILHFEGNSGTDATYDPEDTYEPALSDEVSNLENLFTRITPALGPDGQAVTDYTSSALIDRMIRPRGRNAHSLVSEGGWVDPYGENALPALANGSVDIRPSLLRYVRPERRPASAL